VNSFGLGLVLNFVDNASGSMATACANLNSMSATVDSVSASISGSAMDMYAVAQSMNAVGDTFMSIGNSVVGVYGQVIKSVIDTGMSMQGYRMQLNALYGSESKGEEKLKQIKQYAMASVFQFQDLIPAVTMMKAVGIEAMDDVTTSAGHHTQKLLDYASDIAAMVPNMRNTYGTGVKAAMGAIKEYVAEGNAMSLKRGAGLDITGILGEKKGSTMKERAQQVADLTEKLGIFGYTTALAGTPTQRLSNMEDALFNSLAQIADSGVFEVFCNMLEKVSNFVFDLVNNQKSFNAITGVISDTITTILKPLNMLIDALVKYGDKIVDFIELHPILTKNILLLVAAVGALAVVFGLAMKVAGSFFMMSIGFRNFGRLPALLGIVKTGISGIITKAIPLIAMGYLLYTAWNQDWFGIQEKVGTLFDKLHLISAYFANGGMFTNMKDYNLAKKLGILPTIELIVNLKGAWSAFVGGFKKGVKELISGVTVFLAKLDKVTGLNFSGVFKKALGFFNGLFSKKNDAKWEAMGKVIAKLVIPIILVSGAVKTLTTVFGGLKLGASIFGKLLKLPFKPFLGFFSKAAFGVRAVAGGAATLPEGLAYVFPVLGKIISVVRKIFSVVGKVFGFVGKTIIPGIIKGVSALFSFLVANPIVAVIAAIVIAVVALSILIYKNWDKIKAVLGKVGSWIHNKIILPVRNFFVNVINFIVGLFATGWKLAKAIFTPIGKWIYNHIIQPVVGFFKWLGTSISNVVSSVWNWICNVWGAISGWVNTTIIQPVAGFFKWLFTSISGVFSAVWDWLCAVWSPIAEWVNTTIIKPVSKFFSGLWKVIDHIFKGIYKSITGWFKKAFKVVTSVWKGIKGFFKGIFDKVSGWSSKITKKGSKITGLQTVPHAATGVDNFIGGLIQVNEKGGELIDLPSGSRVIPHDASIQESLKDGITMGIKAMNSYPQSKTTTPTQEIKNDYSVTFAAGSVVIRLDNASDAELEKAAEKLMKIIERKQRLKALAVRK
jgi:phage-related protein